MGEQLGELAPHLIAMLVGALVPTAAVMFGARSKAGRARLAKLSGAGLTTVTVVAVVVAGGLGYASAQPLLDAIRSDGSFPGPATLGGLGLAVGAVFAVPNLILVWMDEQARERKRTKRRDYVPTKDDRREFAANLAKQIRELSSPPRDADVSAGGDGDRVLQIRGDFDAKEGDRLTAALRADLKELGFKRVEGTGGKKDWWSRV